MNYAEIYSEDYYSLYGNMGIPYIGNQLLMGNFRLLAYNLKSMFPDAKTHLDVGCAAGYLVDKMRDIGLESTGVDLPYIIKTTNVQNLHAFDLTKIYLPDVLPDSKYDLVTCIEVAEHIYKEDENNFFFNLKNVTGKYLMFSSAEDYDEPTHVNVHPAEYWKQKLTEFGFSELKKSYRPIPWATFWKKNDG